MKSSRLAVGITLLGNAVACTDHRTPLASPQSERTALTSSVTDTASLGRKIFFDQTLSANGNQSCAACHDPTSGWTGPLSSINEGGAVYEGSVAGLFGNRKPPSSAYATQSPILHLVIDKKDVLFVGGMFWDGRATGERLQSPTAEQALGPFLNPLEQALGTSSDVVNRICSGTYGADFRAVWGDAMCDAAQVNAAYDAVGRSIAAFEGSSESNAFTSKFDAFRAGQAMLTPEERLGLAMFQGKAKCAGCHVLDGEALFTDYTFDNIGVPKNPQNPFYDNTAFNPLGAAWVDLGLGEFLATRSDFQSRAEENLGKQKVPTLRNVDLRPSPSFVKAYGHNGYFKTLAGIVHFYNTRDVKPTCPGPYAEAEALAAGCWPPPEVATNVNSAELGNLHLTAMQERAIVAFLKTLSDGYQP
jgi:cytochrome c peroxidase